MWNIKGKEESHEGMAEERKCRKSYMLSIDDPSYIYETTLAIYTRRSLLQSKDFTDKVNTRVFRQQTVQKLGLPHHIMQLLFCRYNQSPL